MSRYQSDLLICRRIFNSVTVKKKITVIDKRFPCVYIYDLIASNRTKWLLLQAYDFWGRTAVNSIIFVYWFIFIFFRHSQHGVIHIYEKPGLRSKTSMKTFEMGWNWCSCWRSSPARRCPSLIEESCASTKLLMSTKH